MIKSHSSWTEYLRLLLAFICGMFGSVKNRDNGKDREENWGENIIYLYLVELKSWRKENAGLNIFHPSLPKCISLNLRENRVENKRKNPNDFFTPVPCCLSVAKVVFFFWIPRTFLLPNTAADTKREFGQLLRSTANGELVRLMNSEIEKE